LWADTANFWQKVSRFDGKTRMNLTYNVRACIVAFGLDFVAVDVRHVIKMKIHANFSGNS